MKQEPDSRLRHRFWGTVAVAGVIAGGWGCGGIELDLEVFHVPEGEVSLGNACLGVLDELLSHSVVLLSHKHMRHQSGVVERYNH